MSQSNRDRDLRRLRQLAKARNALFPRPCSRQEEAAVRGSAEFRALQAEVDALLAKYAHNASLNSHGDRANSRRDAARRRKEAARRRVKRSMKQEERAEVQAILIEDVRDGTRDDADRSHAGEPEAPSSATPFRVHASEREDVALQPVGVTRVRLAIDADILGPFSVGTVSVIRVVREHLGLSLAAAKALVDRCAFGGETVEIAVESSQKAHALALALRALEGAPPSGDVPLRIDPAREPAGEPGHDHVGHQEHLDDQRDEEA
ncbi:MAG: hypothetical protein R3A52_00260 [Polyangiales bacterium]